MLPEGQQNKEGLKQNLKSPQYLQAVDSLENALCSEEGLTVLISMGLDSDNFYENPDGLFIYY